MELNNDEIEFYRQDLQECKQNRNFYSLHNLELARKIYEFFKDEFFKSDVEKLELWEFPQGQYLTFGVDTKTKLIVLFKRLIKNQKRILTETEIVKNNLLASLNSDLEKFEQSTK